jgi:hypothetical protein
MTTYKYVKFYDTPDEYRTSVDLKVHFAQKCMLKWIFYLFMERL